MPNNLILRRVEVTDEYRPLTDAPLVGTVTLSAAPANAGPVFLRGDKGEDVPLHQSEFHTLKRIDLSLVHLKGQSGDYVTVIGGTWRE